MLDEELKVEARGSGFCVGVGDEWAVKCLLDRGEYVGVSLNSLYGGTFGDVERLDGAFLGRGWWWWYGRVALRGGIGW